MPKTILGLSAFYHDSAACLLVDGKIVAAAQEERFSRKKHDAEFPAGAARYCLAEGGLSPGDVDHVAFYDKPLLKFERLFETYLDYAPRGFGSFQKAMPLWLTNRLWMEETIRRELGTGARVLFGDHHESHAASAFYPSPFEEAAILTMDGVGEWATSSLGSGKGNTIDLISELRFPHSIGLLYSAFTYFCGFKVNSGEYKLMGLAPYGEPRYAPLLREKLVHVCDDGSIRLNMEYFDFPSRLRMTGEGFERLFGGPARPPESKLTQREMDLAASIQEVTEEIVLKMARHLKKTTGARYLCMAGGVALNCVANGRLLKERVFDDVWIQPAAGDAGGAVGAALAIWHRYLGEPRESAEKKGTWRPKNPSNPIPPYEDGMSGSFLGPSFSSKDISAWLESHHYPFRTVSRDELPDAVAELLSQEKVVGLLQGRMEFGPRALGGRSILGDPRSPRMQSVMNLKIKFRESFRPFAPSVLAEENSQYFEMAPGVESPYMLLVAPVQPSKRAELDGEDSRAKGIDRLKLRRSEIPAVTHVDYSARVQTVDAQRRGRYYRLIKAFQAKTGCGVIVNTSFNVRGEPIVCTPEDAYRCFMATNMDALVLERFVLLKEEQTGAGQRLDEYLAQFALD